MKLRASDAQCLFENICKIGDRVGLMLPYRLTEEPIVRLSVKCSSPIWGSIGGVPFQCLAEQRVSDADVEEELVFWKENFNFPGFVLSWKIRGTASAYSQHSSVDVETNNGLVACAQQFPSKQGFLGKVTRSQVAGRREGQRLAISAVGLAWRRVLGAKLG